VDAPLCRPTLITKEGRPRSSHARVRANVRMKPGVHRERWQFRVMLLRSQVVKAGCPLVTLYPSRSLVSGVGGNDIGESFIRQNV